MHGNGCVRYGCFTKITFFAQTVDWNSAKNSSFKLTTVSLDYPAGNYMFKASNRNIITKCEICSKLTIKTSEWHH